MAPMNRSESDTDVRCGAVHADSVALMMAGAYVRPGWTGKPYSGGVGDAAAENSECPSCLTFHHASYLSCNGKREPCDRQCEAVLGEIRCHRPANHLGEHQAKGSGLRVDWQVEN